MLMTKLGFNLINGFIRSAHEMKSCVMVLIPKIKVSAMVPNGAQYFFHRFNIECIIMFCKLDLIS